MPKRYLIVLLLFFCTAYINVTKHALFKVMDMMVKQGSPNSTKTRKMSKLCPPPEKNQSFIADEYVGEEHGYEWTKLTIANSKSIQFSSYAIGHFIGGYVADKCGSKYVIGASITSLSSITLFWPIIVNWTSGHVTVVYALVLLMGAFMGCLYPAIYSALGHWVPYREYGRLCCFTFSGLPFGTMLVKSYTVRLVTNTNNWRNPLYLYGGVGLGISMLWLLLGSSNPRNYSSMDSEEDLYLKTQMEDRVDHDKKEVPWREILTSKEIWALAIGTYGLLCYRTVIGLFQSKFLRDVIGVDTDDSVVWGPMSSFARMLTGIAAGIFTDYAVNRNLVDAVFLRHIFTNIAMMGPPIYTLAMSFAICHKSLSQVLLFAASTLGGLIFAGLRLVPIDLSPNYCGTVAAITHGLAVTTGPIFSLIRKSKSDRDVWDYRTIFFVTLGASTIANLIFLIFGTTSLMKWNTPPSRKRQ